MRILKLSNKKKEVTKITKKALEKGEVIIFPTDTVYGLVCNATNPEAVKKIFRIKDRSLDKPIGVFVKDVEMIKMFAEVSKEQENFLRRLEERISKITMVLEQREDCGLPKILFGGKKTIGIRVSDHKLIQDLFLEINFPLAQTSANISGLRASTKIQEVLKQFENQVIQPDLVLDGGDLEESNPSTVIDLTSRNPQVLREGEISREVIFKAF